MWYKSEGGDIKPAAVDETSSKKVVFVRKDFRQEERTDMDGEPYLVWVWYETKIPKEDWETYKMAMQNTTDIADLTDAVIELAGILGGE